MTKHWSPIGRSFILARSMGRFALLPADSYAWEPSRAVRKRSIRRSPAFVRRHLLAHKYRNITARAERCSALSKAPCCLMTYQVIYRRDVRNKVFITRGRTLSHDAALKTHFGCNQPGNCSRKDLLEAVFIQTNACFTVELFAVIHSRRNALLGALLRGVHPHKNTDGIVSIEYRNICPRLRMAQSASNTVFARALLLVYIRV